MVSKNNKFKIIFLILGCILLWFPFTLPLIFAFFSLVQNGHFLFDFLIPLEIFPVVLIGALLITATFLISKIHMKIIISSLIGVICSLLFVLIYSQISGLASGETGILSLSGSLIVLSIIIYYFSAITIGIMGLLHLKRILKNNLN